MSLRKLDPEHDTYVSLATYRRDGREVRTPLWIAGTGAEFHAFSAGNAGKLKRIRANPGVKLAPCDMRGGALGEWREARARLLTDPTEIATAHAALRRKYGLQMWVADMASRLAGRLGSRVYLTFVLASSTT